MTPEQEQAVLDLRTRNVAPKQIARQLGLRPAEVSALIKAQAEQAATARLATGELNLLFQCLVNQNCLAGLFPERQMESATDPSPESEEDTDAGLAVIILSRKAGFNRLEVCTYLVDLWCLGVKDVSGPRLMPPSTYKEFVEFAYKPFPAGVEAIPLELAQAIVFGGIEYAKTLGFQPHSEFELVRSQLGNWDGTSALTFGRNGKPCYVNGPYDDPIKTLRILRETVGEGNFDFILADED
ncbi:DNA-binding response regulator [Phormidium sp. CLA17]|uniref:DNA-binding response regulator n=1 Tax=Leptolyngbya sp. Cla-17 TaxID=2803751 RepID=UPI001492F9A1|nr:DNA-binding response regulator [Leptolyngbya sp. Cla-17]MBM0740627.1 DNA-binding response regulator [Leptolyngbya sp. Cla-17]